MKTISVKVFPDAGYPLHEMAGKQAEEVQEAPNFNSTLPWTFRESVPINSYIFINGVTSTNWKRMLVRIEKVLNPIRYESNIPLCIMKIAKKREI